MAAPIVIEDPDDPRLAPFRANERGLASRADKRDDAGAGRFLAEGDLVVERAVAAGCAPVAALVDPGDVPPIASALDCPVYGGGPAVRRLAGGLGSPQRVIALFHRPPRPPVAELVAGARRLVVAEAVDNPANVGAIVRNASAFGWDGLVLDHTSADPLARRALRVSMGTAFALPHARTTDLAGELSRLARRTGLRLLALTPDAAARPIDGVDGGGRLAVLVGSERSGLSEALLGMAEAVRIPMADGVDSLNVAAATAVACWQLRG